MCKEESSTASDSQTVCRDTLVAKKIYCVAKTVKIFFFKAVKIFLFKTGFFF